MASDVRHRRDAGAAGRATGVADHLRPDDCGVVGTDTGRRISTCRSGNGAGTGIELGLSPEAEAENGGELVGVLLAEQLEGPEFAGQAFLVSFRVCFHLPTHGIHRILFEGVVGLRVTPTRHTEPGWPRPLLDRPYAGPHFRVRQHFLYDGDLQPALGDLVVDAPRRTDLANVDPAR